MGAEPNAVTGLPAIAALGFFLGMRHATDPDHVIAISTIVTRARGTRHAALIGAVWGLGHTFTILVVGVGIILLGWVIPPRVGLSLELSVGVMLIILGLMNLSGLLARVPAGPASHAHAHPHGDYVHTHPHGHDPEAHSHAPEQTPVAWLDHHLGTLGLYLLLRPLIVGVVHGLAGSAAVALLVLATIPSPAWAVAYLLVFGFGTIVGMMVITALIALPVSVAGPRRIALQRGLRVGSGLLSLGFGLFLAYHIGVVQGLFTGRPEWTPH
jgi:ABC-type nickel/cobalt efflux system permease component RcnA